MHLRPWLVWRDLRALTSGDVDAYAAKRLKQKTRRKRPVSPACVNRELALLKSILRRACDDGKLPGVPRIRMLREPPGRAPLLDAEQERALVAACDSQRLRMLVLLGIETGCRLSELTGLRWRDLDLSAGILRVERSKSGKRRDLPLSAVALDLLRTWRPDGVPAGRYVLPTRSGRRWLAAQRPWERATNAAGLAGWRLHDLRHVFASRAVMRGVDLLTVARLLGHASTKMVERYAHLSPHHVAAAMMGPPAAAPAPRSVPSPGSTEEGCPKSP